MENPAFTPDQNESEFIVDNEETDELRELAGVWLFLVEISLICFKA